MKSFAIMMICLTHMASGQVPEPFHKSVYDACLTRDELRLVSTKSDFDTTSNFTVLSLEVALYRMDAAERRMRISLRENKKETDLVPKILREITGEHNMWYLNPTRIIAALLLVQRDHPESIKEVCGGYEAAIAEMQRYADSQHSKYVEWEFQLLHLLKREPYPCISYVDNEIMWENMPVLKFLEKLRTDADSKKESGK